MQKQAVLQELNHPGQPAFRGRAERHQPVGRTAPSDLSGSMTGTAASRAMLTPLLRAAAGHP
eukprot:5392309-Prymnesium_polylepis.1